MGLPVNPAKVEGHCKIGRDPINETFSNWLWWIAVIESTSVCITLGTTWWVGLSALMKTQDQFQEVYLLLLLLLWYNIYIIIYIHSFWTKQPWWSWFSYCRSFPVVQKWPGAPSNGLMVTTSILSENDTSWKQSFTGENRSVMIFLEN